MTKSVAFINGFKTFEDAEQHLKTYLDPKPDMMGVISIHTRDGDNSLFAITSIAAIEKMLE